LRNGALQDTVLIRVGSGKHDEAEASVAAYGELFASPHHFCYCCQKSGVKSMVPNPMECCQLKNCLNEMYSST
jgi:hypothetical protein